MENKLIFAKEIIKEAGAFIKESLSKTITVEEKTAFDDLVTNIDKQTQDLLVHVLNLPSLQTIFSLKKMAWCIISKMEMSGSWILLMERSILLSNKIIFV